MVDSETLRFLLFLSLCDLCLFTSTHKHTGGGLSRTVKTFHWYSQVVCTGSPPLLNAALALLEFLSWKMYVYKQTYVDLNQEVIFT